MLAAVAVGPASVAHAGAAQPVVQRPVLMTSITTAGDYFSDRVRWIRQTPPDRFTRYCLTLTMTTLAPGFASYVGANPTSSAPGVTYQPGGGGAPESLSVAHVPQAFSDRGYFSVSARDDVSVSIHRLLLNPPEITIWSHTWSTVTTIAFTGANNAVLSGDLDDHTHLALTLDKAICSVPW
jgi:hypothetical protein